MVAIIGTVGPSSIDSSVLQQLKAEGLESFRLNLSHLNKNSLEEYYSVLKENSIPPSLDTQGAQVRVVKLPAKDNFSLNETITMAYFNLIEGNDEDLNFDIGINHCEFFDFIVCGDEIKLGFDGLLGLVQSVSPRDKRCVVKVSNPGSIVLNRAIDVTGKSIQLEPFTDFDISAIKESVCHGVDRIYVSFCSSIDTVMRLKCLLEEVYSHDNLPKIIAKIENKMGLLNLPEIAAVVDGVLIDRGDLSREIRISILPSVVSSIIRTCKALKVPCYIATNILDSMMVGDLPSRAEISDIHNLLLQGVHGFVLAAEMAIGKHPVESVQILRLMSKIHELEVRGIAAQYSIDDIIHNMSPKLRSWL